MVNFFKNLSLRAKVAVLSAIVAVCNSQFALAQGENIGQDILRESTSTMNNLLGLIANVVRIALGIGALVTLVLAVFNLIKGEREAAQKIGYWVVGLALGFALITVVVRVVSTSVA